MSIKNHITDPSTGTQAEVDCSEGESHALVVAARDHKIFTNEVIFFSNPDYGIAMNQGASPTGTPEYVHNGTDDTYWTGSSIVGVKTLFSSVDQSHNGTYSIKTDNADVDDVYQFAKGSDLILSNYISLTMWIYVDKDWNAGDSIEVCGWDTGTNSQIGISAALEDYFTWNSFDIWHKISIPLEDMNLVGTMNALRFKQVADEGKAPKYYLDDIQFELSEAAGGIAPISFCVTPEKDSWLHVSSLHVFIADNDYNSDNEHGTVPAIPYNSWLGVAALDSGLRYLRVQDETVRESLIFRQLSDILKLPGVSLDSYGSSNTGINTWISISVRIHEPVILKAENHDELQFTISDDLSGLDQLTISAHARKEWRPNGKYSHPPF